MIDHHDEHVDDMEVEVEQAEFVSNTHMPENMEILTKTLKEDASKDEPIEIEE